jgi:8-oxo-dGTP diphosphatase
VPTPWSSKLCGLKATTFTIVPVGRCLSASQYAGDVVLPDDGARLRVSVDVVALSIVDGRLSALVCRRAEPPYQGRWALPGALLATDQSLEAAARGALRDRTGLQPKRIEQLATYGDPRRDPRHRTVSVAWLAVLPGAGDPDRGAAWRPADRLQAGTRLAFDHRHLLADGVERTRAKLEHSTIATAFLDTEFTVAALRAVYEVVWGQPLDAGNFHRKVTRTAGFVQPTGRHRRVGRGRPAELFSAGPQEVLQPPLTRRSLA